MYYASFHLATFVFFMSPRFGTCVSHLANSILLIFMHVPVNDSMFTKQVIFFREISLICFFIVNFTNLFFLLTFM